MRSSLAELAGATTAIVLPGASASGLRGFGMEGAAKKEYTTRRRGANPFIRPHVARTTMRLDRRKPSRRSEPSLVAMCELEGYRARYSCHKALAAGRRLGLRRIWNEVRRYV